MTAKEAVTSKINWVGLILLVAGFITDPQFTALLPAQYASLILKISGPLLFILRTFFTKPKDDTARPLQVG